LIHVQAVFARLVRPVGPDGEERGIRRLHGRRFVQFLDHVVIARGIPVPAVVRKHPQETGTHQNDDEVLIADRGGGCGDQRHENSVEKTTEECAEDTMNVGEWLGPWSGRISSEGELQVDLMAMEFGTTLDRESSPCLLGAGPPPYTPRKQR